MFTGNPIGEKEQPVKRKRVLLSLAQKIELLDAIDEGGTFSSVAKKFKLSDSTVRTIKAAEQSIRNSVRYGSAVSNSIIKASRPPCIEFMETKLNEWVVTQMNNGSKPSNRDITEMAKKIFIEVKKPGDGTDFKASNTWLVNFKKRFSIINVAGLTHTNYTDASNDEAADQMHNNNTDASNNEAADQFIDKFKSCIEEYLPEQVFNIDDEILYWKRLPIADFKNNPEKLAVLFGCNASGDFMSKPLFVHKRENPQRMTDELLPVFWSTNPTSCISEAELTEWYLESFLPSVREFLVSKYLTFKILLLMEETPRNEMIAKIKIPNVTVLLFPPTTKSKIQPLSCGIFAAFKRYYLRHVLSHLSQIMFLDPSQKLNERWKAFSVTDSVEVIRDAIDEITASDINSCWRKLWPDVVHQYSTLPSEQIEIEEILQVVREINDPSCYEVQAKDIEFVLRSYEPVKKCSSGNGSVKDDENLEDASGASGSDSNLSVSKIVENSNEFIIRNEAETPIETFQNNATATGLPPLIMPLDSLKKIFASAKALEQLVLELDPSVLRSMKFSDSLDELLIPYKEEQSKHEPYI